MRLLLFIFSIGTLLTFSSCTDDGSGNEIPDCINEKVDELRADLCPGTADLTKWQFQGETVYCFYFGTCTEDAKAVIYDKDCNELCTLFGRSGNTECKGETWDGNATGREVLLTF